MAANDQCTAEHPTGGSSTVTIDYDGGFTTLGGIASIEPAHSVTFRDMTLTDATANYGGIIWADADTTVLLDDVKISDGVAGSYGGGIRSYGTVELINDTSVVSNDATTGVGGGISMGVNGTLIMRNFAQVGDYTDANFALYRGGGVSLNDANLEMYNFSNIKCNSTADLGGGIYADDTSDIFMNDYSRIGHVGPSSHNVAISGAGVYITDHGTSLNMFDQSSILRNEADSDGGGVYATSGADVNVYNDSIIGSTISDQGNTAHDGGGVYITGTGSALSLFPGSSIEYNIVSARGGGIFAKAGAIVTIDGASIMNNSSIHGGGIYLTDLLDPTSMAIQNSSIISGNVATNGSGGGLRIVGAGLTVTVDNSSIDNNSASVGGGLNLRGDSSVTLQNGVSITNNDAEWNSGGGIAVEWGATLTMSDTTIQYNTATTDGGGIAILLGVSPPIITATDCDISWNTADSYGGGIYNEYGTLSLIAASKPFYLNRNTSMRGGALYDSSGKTTLLQAGNGYLLDVSSNTSSGSGGGLYIADGTHLDLSGNVQFTSNSAHWNGGAISVVDATASLVDGADYPLIVWNHATTGSGGGIYAQNVSSLILEGVDLGGEVNGNHAPAGHGGGLYLLGSDAEFDNVTVRNNSCGVWGGGVAVLNGSSLLIHPTLTAAGKAVACDPAALPLDKYCSEFRNNSAGETGGGICLVDFSSVDIDTTAFIDNTAIQDGAAIFSHADTDQLTIRNSFFTGNAGGHAVYLLDTEIFTAEYNTFAGNQDGGVHVGSSSASSMLNNNIEWDNYVASSIAGTVSGTCNNTESGCMPGIISDPLFMPTARGPYRLGYSSPSIDVCSTGYTHDLDNKARPKDGDGNPVSPSEYDMGAFEAVYSSVLPPRPTPDSIVATKLVPDGSQIRVDWDNLTCPADQYILLTGVFEDLPYYSNGCTDNIDPDTDGSYDWSTGPFQDLWFLIVSANSADVEGSWGTTSSGQERNTTPITTSTCSIAKDTWATCP